MPKSAGPSQSKKSAPSDSIIYAIPSFRRANLIGTHSLAMLRENGIQDRDIAILVSGYDELADYGAALKGFKGQLIPKQAPNLVTKFNAVHDHYEPGTRVVFVEDDITGLKVKTGENALSPFKDLRHLAEDSFDECISNRTKLWGISSNANPFYMKDGRSIGFKFVVANIFGFISTRDPFLRISQVCKSDYERTMLYYTRFGSIVRNDGVCAITKNYRTPGGLQDLEDRKGAEEVSCRNLVKRFPHLVEINEKKSKISKYMELKLKRQKIAGLVDLMALQRMIDREVCDSASAAPA